MPGVISSSPSWRLAAYRACRRNTTRGSTGASGVPSVFYHVAFEAGSEAGLAEKRNELLAKGVDVTDVVDHDWAKSIYFKDPNGIQLEYCCFTRNLNDNDARMQDRFELSVRRLGLQDPDALQSRKVTRAESATEVLAKT